MQLLVVQVRYYKYFASIVFFRRRLSFANVAAYRRCCLQALLPSVVFGRLAEADTLKGTYAKNAFCCLYLKESCAAPLCKDGMRAQAVSSPANARANAVVRAATSLHIVALAGQRRNVFPTACVAPSVKRLVPAKEKRFFACRFPQAKKVVPQTQKPPEGGLYESRYL